MTLLISTQKLDELIQKKDKKLSVIDTRSFGEYVLGHIPGSINTELMQFHWSDTTKNGIKQFNKQNTKLFSNFGIKKNTFLVFYENISGPSAARGVWLSLYFSHKKVAMLDGGFDKWRVENRAIDTESEKFQHRKFEGKPNSSILADLNFMKKVIKKKKDFQIIDVRTSDEFSGQQVRACRRGHIPLSRNIDWNTNVKDGRFKSLNELKKIYTEISPDKETVTYCQGGYRAANTFVILSELGFKKAKLYLGSWNEWGNDMSLPIENN